MRNQIKNEIKKLGTNACQNQKKCVTLFHSVPIPETLKKSNCQNTPK
ncbi:hypothetical protein SAMN02910298_01159 [Pseudobutyrivibrio sp. YE44]|nr:hypothetical protein [Pseudobutyrivibrio sp. YE44]SDB23564.1 hypothetical protein SAMN02910298_01159 [Pseudobutyrivibrio sp. YE44]